MHLFGSHESKPRYGMLIDIGSGSVLVAIVCSDPTKPHPEIIWSFREHAPLKNIDSLQMSSKSVMTSLVNAAMKIDSEGRTALREHTPGAKISVVQCGVSAPWSYTVTKTIRYKQEKDFTVTQEIIEELAETIENAIVNELKEHEEMNQFNLQVTAQTTTNLEANGYPVARPYKQKARRVSLSSSSAVMQKYLVDQVHDLHNKLFAHTKTKLLSFILMMHEVTKHLVPSTDLCLVDLTYEATEIGIVRRGTLTYCTHAPYGVFSLAREIAAIIDIPLHEAFGYLHTETPFSFIDSLNTKQKTELELMFERYIEKISKLFHETGDTLAIPNHLVIHTDIKTETLFHDLIEKAVIRAIKTHPHITLLSSKILKKVYSHEQSKNAKITVDTALLVSAQFFHTQTQSETFHYR